MWWVGSARIQRPGPSNASSVAFAEAMRASVDRPTRRGAPALEPEVGITRSIPSKNAGSWVILSARPGYFSDGKAS